MTVEAHFDGKVIVPERIQESALSWLVANAVDSDTLPADLAERHDHYLHGAGRGSPSGPSGIDMLTLDCPAASGDVIAEVSVGRPMARYNRKLVTRDPDRSSPEQDRSA